ncbi:hypothetical protein [Allopontixanthobacter sp.]|uniref:hypothetical protein n=1 Tax=Allopontixanthobacter sp. TaxID=2906452 RepID=UPI002ABA7864|nr:hypothetical protein [Allopontixanthobacter sp.]MDZ4307561.1 hypothetical protein [Allopontixanthobacter sp.]
MAESLVWKGKALTETMREAQKLGVNATMSECVIHAKSNHSWQNRTGVLEGSLGVAEFAREVPGGVEGSWGSQDVRYALIHELGGVIVPIRAKALAIPQEGGGVRFVKSVTIPARPYLRPAADVTYPALGSNIGKAYRALGGGGGSSGGNSRA